MPVRLLAVLLSALFGGCSATKYIARQSLGQLKVLTGREPIVEVLRHPELKPGWHYKLQLVLLARRFAHEEIGLRLSGAYTYFFDTKNKPIAYNLSAAPKTELRPKRWRFPIVGAVPYLGFFKKQEAKQAEAKLKAIDYDTLLRPVSAYSSLGWFDDPIYSTLLDRDPWRIVDLVIHETTHATVFFSNAVSFNESLAMFVASQGTINLMARLLGPLAPQVKKYQQQNARLQQFARLIGEARTRLKRLYASNLSRAEKLRRRELEFARAQKRYKQMFPDPDTWGRFVRRKLNNAVMLSYGRYHGGLTFHRRVYQALGRNLRRFVALYKHAAQFDDPIGYIARTGGVPKP